MRRDPRFDRRYYFHGTSRARLASIAEHGLRAGSCERYGTDRSGIFFSTDRLNAWTFAVQSVIFDEGGTDEDFCALRPWEKQFPKAAVLRVPRRIVHAACDLREDTFVRDSVIATGCMIAPEEIEVKFAGLRRMNVHEVGRWISLSKAARGAKGRRSAGNK